MKKYFTTKRVAGRKQVKKEESYKSYSIYDNCNVCPLWVYIDIVCHSKDESLIISGNVDKNILESVKQSLVLEFSELTGDSQTLGMRLRLEKIYQLKNEILGLSVCLELLQDDNYNDVISYCKSVKIPISNEITPENYQNTYNKLESRLKSKNVQLKEELKQYEKLYNNDSKHKPNEQHFNEQLAVLSKHNGFRIDKNISLAEYAAYIKNFNDYVKFNINKQ